jgi:precorrin-6Y C5,15-methyltransferase (decarboxylating)
MAAGNAQALGVPALKLVDGYVPAALEGLAAPDAIFIGGGLSRETFTACWVALRPLGRLVANAVTLESEALLVELYKEFGGDLVQISVNRVEPLGSLTSWKPLRPVTQWSLIKR